MGSVLSGESVIISPSFWFSSYASQGLLHVGLILRQLNHRIGKLRKVFSSHVSRLQPGMERVGIS